MDHSVHVIIVNWNSGQQLGECLSSLAAVRDEAALRVTVVDNASSDGSLDGLPTPAIPLAVTRNTLNRGFGAACNQGAAGSDSEFLLFLNPDARLMPGSLAGPVAYLRASEHEAIGIVGIRLLDENGTVARNTARAPTAASMVGNSIGLDRLLPAV